jgi:predicted transcriptional regulator
MLKPAQPDPPAEQHAWTFLTNHAHVLIVLAKDPHMRMRDVAARIGITERAVQRIVADLVASGVVEAIRDGRRNRYRIHGLQHMRHPIEAHRRIADLIKLGC